MIAQASGHRRRNPQRLVDSGEVVIDRMNRNHRRVIFKLLTKAVRQARESAHPHPHRQVVPLHVGRAYMLGVDSTGLKFKLIHYPKTRPLSLSGKFISNASLWSTD